MDLSVISFAAAVVLARHMVSGGIPKLVPFVVDSDRVADTISCGEFGECYVVGVFDDPAIDALVSRKTRVTLIGKLYGRKYGRLSKPVKVGDVRIYPVRKVRMRGMEYFSALTTYFGVSDAPIFMKLSDISLELAKILITTDGWIDMFHLLSSIEVVSSPDDVDRVVEYFKKSKNFDEEYKKLMDAVGRTIVESTKNHIIIGLRDPPVPSKKIMMVARYVLNTKPLMFILTPLGGGGHRVIVVSRQSLRKPHLSGLQTVYNADVEAVYGNVAYLKCRPSSWEEVIEKTRLVSNMLAKVRI